MRLVLLVTVLVIFNIKYFNFYWSNAPLFDKIGIYCYNKDDSLFMGIKNQLDNIVDRQAGD